MNDLAQTMTELPWGMVIILAYRVPRIVAGANRIMAAGGRVFRSRKALVFKEHIYASTLKLIGDLRRRDPALAAVKFPIEGERCQLRVDVAFGFSQSGRGPARMRSSDRDNLAKMFYDGLEGALVDDDRWITEGYIAKGQAPEGASDEMIYATVSRAGFRDPKHLWALTTLGVLPPWAPKREPSRIIKPGIHIQ